MSNAQIIVERIEFDYVAFRRKAHSLQTWDGTQRVPALTVLRQVLILTLFLEHLCYNGATPQ